MDRLVNPELGQYLWANMRAVLYYLWPIFLGSLWSLFMFRLGRVVENRMWVRHPEFQKSANQDMIKELKADLRTARQEVDRLENRNRYLTTVVQTMVNVAGSVKRL